MENAKDMETSENPIQQKTASISVPQPKLNKVLVIVLSILLLVSIATSALFYFQTRSLRQELAKSKNVTNAAVSTPTPATSTQSTTPITVFTDKYDFGTKIEQEFDKIAQEYKGQVIPNTKSYVWWISNDNFNIINNDEVGLDYQNYSCESDYKNKEVFNGVSSKLSESIKSVMASFGFNLNQRNSSKSITDDQFYDYVQAYEKGGIKCTLTASPDCGTSSDAVPMHYDFSFACTNSFDNNYQEQIPYLKGLNITNAIIHVAKKVGDYVYINVNYRRTGHYTIAQVINGVWTELHSGQDVPDCKTMEEHQVPQEVYGNCYSSDGN